MPVMLGPIHVSHVRLANAPWAGAIMGGCDGSPLAPCLPGGDRTVVPGTILPLLSYQAEGIE